MSETQTWSEESFGSEALAYCLALLARFGRSRNAGVASPGAVSELSESSGLSADSSHSSSDALTEASEALTGRIEGIRALALLSLDGEIHDSIVLDRSVSPEALSEFATLVRIADRTSRDAGALALAETTWSSEGGTILSCRVDRERFLLLVGSAALRTSLARYALRQTARGMTGPGFPFDP